VPTLCPHPQIDPAGCSQTPLCATHPRKDGQESSASKKLAGEAEQAPGSVQLLSSTRRNRSRATPLRSKQDHCPDPSAAAAQQLPHYRPHTMQVDHTPCKRTSTQMQYLYACGVWDTSSTWLIWVCGQSFSHASSHTRSIDQAVRRRCAASNTVL
jgi:hypothetical protein